LATIIGHDQLSNNLIVSQELRRQRFFARQPAKNGSQAVNVARRSLTQCNENVAHAKTSARRRRAWSNAPDLDPCSLCQAQAFGKRRKDRNRMPMETQRSAPHLPPAIADKVLPELLHCRL
jgi:hypothetical protein